MEGLRRALRGDEGRARDARGTRRAGARTSRTGGPSAGSGPLSSAVSLGGEVAGQGVTCRKTRGWVLTRSEGASACTRRGDSENSESGEGLRRGVGV